MHLPDIVSTWLAQRKLSLTDFVEAAIDSDEWQVARDGEEQRGGCEDAIFRECVLLHVATCRYVRFSYNSWLFSEYGLFEEDPVEVFPRRVAITQYRTAAELAQEA